MSNSPCLTGIAFSLTGNLTYTDQLVSFAPSFDSASDQATVLAYEWYLDHNVIIDQQGSSLAAAVACGVHTIGLRILTGEGWSGIKSLTFQTCVAQLNVSVSGPLSVIEGGTAAFTVSQKMPDGTSQDVTSQFNFAASEGSFVGAVFTPASNASGKAIRKVTVTASKAGTPPITTSIYVTDSSINTSLGILTIDLFNNNSLNVIALIDNPGVAENHVAAYKGTNFVPLSSTVAPEATIVASDYIDQVPLNWRFEFNIAKLVANNPSVPVFNFYIKGRGNLAGSINGGYSVKSDDTLMIMTGVPGSYLPTVTGGTNVIGNTPFTATILGGANGSYNESDLTTIVQFTYNVASKTLTKTG